MWVPFNTAAVGLTRQRRRWRAC